MQVVRVFVIISQFIIALCQFAIIVAKEDCIRDDDEHNSTLGNWLIALLAMITAYLLM